MTTTFVALLRGINVGGRNFIRMPALAACFEAGGFEDVVTYIQSGNIVFRSKDADPGEVAARIEAMVATTRNWNTTTKLLGLTAASDAASDAASESR